MEISENEAVEKSTLTQTSNTQTDPKYLASINTIEIIINQLRKRASMQRRQAIFILLLIFVSLVGGLFLFGYAGLLAVTEADRTSTLLEQRASRLIDDKKYINQKMAEKEFELANPAISSQEKKEIITELNNLKNRAAYIESQVEVIGNSPQPSTNTIINEQFISVITTRIGSLLILLFLVQILITLYRYSTRLAAYYDARADAIELLPHINGIDLPQLISSFSPERLDFGRTPESPIQNTIELAKEITNARK